MTSSRGRFAHRKTILLASAARVYLRLLAATTRIETIGLTPEEVRSRGAFPCVGVFWHARLLWPALEFRGPDYAVLVSDHFDGELIGRIVAGWGTRTVPGSSLRGGTEALRAAHRLLAEGVSIAIAPDGPVGPREVAKAGAVALAKLSGRPIVPMSFAPTLALTLSTWDRLRVPLPGSRLVVAVGEPLLVPPDLDPDGIERYRLQMEASLVELTRRVDARVRRSPKESVTASA
jgi:lysophospholipid acyltransferase (LPLAT)-like uncharacterized protein